MIIKCIKLFFTLALLFLGQVQAQITPASVDVPGWDSREMLDFSTLPFELSIKEIKGDGSRQLALFGDPNCPYTKQAVEQLSELTDVTIHVFPAAFIGGQKSESQVQQVFCRSTNEERVAAWKSLVLQGEESEVITDCRANNGEKIRASFGQLRSSVGLYRNIAPTLIFSNDLAHPGPLPADDIEFLLDYQP
ncbi:thioredoxin fold domain-containing protein [Pusillimonas maritima]|jgi:thiol:disulfide interchange protein DsbC|uniref:Thioredoxin-like fold domain-containing protein n=2 Tax=Neopusillimonas maritima TaxID=2026239 RepID=A0ABX9MYD8_9BURK|nr:hypothetical protein CJO09_01030 [Neopusillimonas maritima]